MIPTTTSASKLLHSYAAFGGVLRSELAFPELAPAYEGDPGDWSLIVGHGEPSLDGLTPLGERQIREERYRLSRFSHGLRLEYSHAGVFEILNGGTRLVWYYREDAVPELVRNIVLGPVMALALEMAGFLCLHGSAVSVDSSAVAFLGPKHFGKSTLAAALTTAGARLIGDDMLVISPGPPATMRPGVPSVRLWGDMAAALPLEAISSRLIPGVKTTVTDLVDASLATGSPPLDAIYVLSPFLREEDDRAVWRTPLSVTAAAVAIAHHTKLPASLVGLRAAGSQLGLSAAVAAHVPVYTLHTARDVQRLAAIVRQIMEWSCRE